MKHLKIFVILFALAITGCVSDNGSFDTISRRSISLYELTIPNEEVAHDIISISSRHVIVIIPLSKAPTLKDALDEILEKYKGDYLTDVIVKRRSFQLMFWYHYNSWIIEANVVRINK